MALGKKKSSLPAEKAPRIRIAQTTYQKAIIKKIVVQISLALFMAVLVYVAFAATLVRVIPSDTGLVMIKNNTFSGGKVPAGEVVFINMAQEQKDGYMDRLGHSFTMQSNTALVQVIAGPAGALDWSPNGSLKVGGEELPVKVPIDPQREILNNEYIAICLEGSCSEGEVIFFEMNKIYGIPLQKSDLEKGVDVAKLKERVSGDSTTRPTPPEILPLAKFMNSSWSEDENKCFSTVLYNSELSTGALRHFVDSIVDGVDPAPNKEDAALIKKIKQSDDAKSCRDR